MSNLQIQYVSPDRLRPYPGNARTHSRKQIKLIADSIKRFGFINPILVTDDFEVVAGHGRLQAAKSLGMQLVPVVAISSLSEADKKAIRIADNRIAELSHWDRDILAIEYQGLHELQFDDIEVTGFRWARSIPSWTKRPRRSRLDLVRKTICHRSLRRRCREGAIFGSLARTGFCAATPAVLPITLGCSRARTPTWF